MNEYIRGISFIHGYVIAGSHNFQVVIIYKEIILHVSHGPLSPMITCPHISICQIKLSP